RAGALTVVEKPVSIETSYGDDLAKRVCTQLAIMSQVKVVRRRTERLALPHAEPSRRQRPGGYRVLAITSSTGGPGALAQLLGRFGPDFPLPVLLVQHIVPTFLEGFASWLGSICPLPVEIAEDGATLSRGRIYLSKGERHLVADGMRLRLE